MKLTRNQTRNWKRSLITFGQNIGQELGQKNRTSQFFGLLLVEGRTGGVSRTVHEQKKQRITDHGYQNFIFPNHENKQVRYSF